LVINGLEPEQITNLFTNLGAMLGEKLKDEMFVTLITNLTTVNNQIIDRAEQTMQETEEAIEQEQQLIEQIQEEIFERYEQEGYDSEDYGVIIGPAQPQSVIE